MAYISSITHSKEFLQNYKRDQRAFQVSSGVAQKVLQLAAQGQMRHIEHVLSFPMNGMPPDFNERLVYYLKQFFPDSLVEYREVTRLDGTLERGIVIDWS